MIKDKGTKSFWTVSWKVILLLVFAVSLILQTACFFTAESFVSSAVWTNAALYWLAQKWVSSYMPVFVGTLVIFDCIIIGLIVEQYRHFKQSKLSASKKN